MIENAYVQAVRSEPTTYQTGRLTSIHGMVVEASGCDVHLGELVEIQHLGNSEKIIAEVVGLRENKILLMPYRQAAGLSLSSQVLPLGKSLKIALGYELLGRVINPLGEVLDDLTPPSCSENSGFHTEPINPLHRAPIDEVLETGVRAIDCFCPLGRGQRIGILAGSGVGKSTLLGMMARHTNADINVIALIGERGREVGDFIRQNLGEEGLKNSVVIVAGAEQPAVMRRQAAYTATAIAEWFRAKNNNVLLVMDSITRFAFAQREIGLATGEPIGSRGYPASVFALLPPLLERGGKLTGQGSITSVYTVLVEGDDMNEPVTDHLRSILDGHIVLSRELAELNHYPAIDVQKSLSRLSNSLLDQQQQVACSSLRTALAIYDGSKDLVDLGAYEAGQNKALDRVIRYKKDLDHFLQQSPSELSSLQDTWKLAQQLKRKVAD